MSNEKRELWRYVISIKRFVVLGVFLCAAVLVFSLLSRQCGPAPAVPEAPEEPLTLEWSRESLVMNVGETRDIEWTANKTVQPLVYCEGSAVAVTALHGNSVRLMAIAGGVDALTAKAGALQSVCVITVNNEAFSFILPGEDGHDMPIGEIEIGVGEIKSFDVLAEPASLRRQTRINNQIQDKTIADIIDFDNYYVTIQGRKKGYTTLMAEWRGKKIEARLEVTDNEPRAIIVPYTKRYLNIGQETKISVYLENSGAGNETQFRFTAEPAFPAESGKNSISVDGLYNTAVVKALREGVQYIRVSHPLARDSKIITFDVLPLAPPPPSAIELSESPLLVAKGETKPLTMTVMNGKTTDNQKFSFQVAENGYAVEAKQHGNILNITGIAPGAALIRISNSAVSRDLCMALTRNNINRQMLAMSLCFGIGLVYTFLRQGLALALVQACFLFSIPVLKQYNGKLFNSKPLPRAAFYLYYPIHLLLLAGFRWGLGAIPCSLY